MKKVNMKSKKIVHCLYNLKQGGAEQMAIDLCNWQSKTNEVVLLTFWDEEQSSDKLQQNRIDPGVKKIDLGVVQKNKILTIIRIFLCIKSLSPNVVHMHMGRMAYFMILPLLFLRQIRFIQTCHTDPRYEAGSIIERVYRTFLYKIKLIIPVALTQDFKSCFGSYFWNISPYCVNNGRPYKPKTLAYNQVENEVLSYKKTPNTKILIHVARYGKEKNQQMLFNAILSLTQKDCDIVLLVLGAGFDEIKENVQIKDHYSSIYFLGMKKNVEDYLRCSDAFCLSSIFEGMPLAIIEAMLMGCVPIVTPVGALSEMLQQGKFGFISASTNQSDYEQTILAFLKHNHVSRVELVHYSQENYSVKTMADNYYTIYNQGDL